MEHPSKRRRVERRAHRPHGAINMERSGRERAGSLSNSTKEMKLEMPKLVLPPHGDQGFGIIEASRQEVEGLSEPLQGAQIEPTRLYVRQLLPTQPSLVITPTTTVMNVAASNGQGTGSNHVEPIASSVVSVPGYGDLNMNSNSNPSATGSNPGAVTPPPAVAASIARASAQATQEAIAKELDVPPQPPASSADSAVSAVSAASAASAPSAASADNAASSQSPMAIQVPGSSSQQVLSSPSTPLPSTPQSSASSSASYFSSAPASLAISNLPHSTTPSAASPTLNPKNSQLPSTFNSTTTSITSSRTSTAFLGSTSLSSEASGTPSSRLAQSTASQSSLSSIDAVLASLSATQTPSGFVTSTRNSLSSPSPTSSITFAQTTPTPTTFVTSSSASSQSSSLSSPASSLSSGISTTAVGAGGNGGSGSTATATAPSPTSSSGGGGSGGNKSPPTSALVGGIVGGVAGLVMFLAVILLFLRWRRSQKTQPRDISPPIPQSTDLEGAPQTGTMTERSSAALTPVGFIGRFRPSSSQTAATTETAPSERGFQKISGRKITSVLTSGGDGYGENTVAGPSAGPAGSATGVAPGQGPFAGLAPALRPSPPHSLSGSSFYRDSHGFYGGVVPENDQTESSSSPTSLSPPLPMPLALAGRPPGRGSPPNRREEVANMRPGPARTPVINQPGLPMPMRAPSRATPPPRPVRATPPPIVERPRDGVGRSHPSQDGSRGSRFRENVTTP